MLLGSNVVYESVGRWSSMTNDQRGEKSRGEIKQHHNIWNNEYVTRLPGLPLCWQLLIRSIRGDRRTEIQ